MRMRPVTKRVIFYDKGTGGHRLPIQKVIRDHLKPSGYNFDIVVSSKEDNSITFLREVAQQQRFDHCHLLTLDDCLEDFKKAQEDIRWFEKARISFSGTYYLFTHLSPHLLLAKGLWNDPRSIAYLLLKFRLPLHPYTVQQIKAVSKIVRDEIVTAILVPDERLSSRVRYPFWRDKLRLLPDPAIFSNEPSEFERSRKELGWDDQIPTIIMFGWMKYWKGLDLLMEALSESYSHLYLSPFRVVLAGQQVERRPNILLSPAVELVELDHYIENDIAKKLFAAADCVVIPCKKYFEWSSGTFSLACASGKFVIASDSGVLGWRIRELQNGFVYHADRANSLAKAVSRFVDVYHTLSYPVEGSVKYASTCTPDRYVSIMDEVIADSLKGGEQS